ncbi:MAG TPA: ABC transporter permease [Acidisoma sp.]|jgi:ribose transport system permease protein|nr:ABC transporter permease [Acidisoma sp.]
MGGLSWGLLPLLLVVICGYFTIEQPRFIGPRNISNVMVQASYLITLSAAQMMVLIVRGFDLSMGTVLSATSVLLALIITAILHQDANATGLAVVAGVAGALGIGVLAGAVNGACVVFLKVNPFVVTLGTQGIAAGVAATVSGGFPVFGLPMRLTTVLSMGKVGGIPVPVIAAILILLVLYVILNYTVFGRGLYLVGSNPRAAIAAGLPSSSIVLGAYVLCSAVVAIVAILLTARTGSGEPNIGGGFMLQSIAAAVIGGLSLRGGQGTIYHCIIGGLFVTVLSNGMDLLQVDSFLQMVVLGGIFIAAVFLDRLYHATPTG